MVYARRPDSWQRFSYKDAAILDFLRTGGAASELSPEKTVDRLLGHFRTPSQFERLLQVAESEPP